MRVATAAEVGAMLDWAAAEGWNPGLDDAAAFRAADPEGFFVAEAGGAPVAAISVVNHDPGFAFLGLYLCRPAWRGKGIGYALWRHALAHAGERTVGLDGVAAQEANYARSGFVRAGATVRMAGRPGGGAARRAEAADAPVLMALDRVAGGVDRQAFLAAWLAGSPRRVTVVQDGPAGPMGFATARLCREGCKVGPVVAPDAAAGLALAAAAAAALRAEAAILDVPEANLALLARLKGLGFVETFRTARMYRGTAPVAGPMLQAIATMELG